MCGLKPPISDQDPPAGANVSVIVPTYNRRELLSAVLAPLLEDPSTLEVIVVIDGGEDGSFTMMNEMAQFQPKLKPMWQENAGQGSARATGLAAAKGEIVLFIDDDVIAEPGLVTGHKLAHAQSANLLVLGYMPTVLSQPRQPGQVATYLYARDYEEVCAAYEHDPQQVLLNLWAGNVSLPREAALSVGVTVSKGITYHEDKQFGYRCIAAGMQGVFSRSLLARHYHQRSVEQFRDELRRQTDARRVLAAENSETDAQGWLIWRPSGAATIGLRVLSSPAIYEGWTTLALGAMRLAGRMKVWLAETSMLRAIRQVDLYHHTHLPAAASKS